MIVAARQKGKKIDKLYRGRNGRKSWKKQEKVRCDLTNNQSVFECDYCF